METKNQELATQIQNQLVNLYGNTTDGNSKFRLVWSEGLMEKRHGNFAMYYGTLYIGEEFAVRVAKKYNFINEKWILEAYTPEAKSNPEIDSDGYEAIYVFQDDNDNYLVPRLDVCEIYIAIWLTARNGEVPKKTAAQLDREEVEAFEKDVKGIEEALEEHSSSTLMSQFHFGEAVIIHKGNEDTK